MGRRVDVVGGRAEPTDGDRCVHPTYPDLYDDLTRVPQHTSPTRDRDPSGRKYLSAPSGRVAICNATPVVK